MPVRLHELSPSPSVRARTLRAAFFACAVLLGAPPCLAGSDALTDKAASLYDEGMVAFSKSRWPEARASFLAAWALKNHWQIAASLGDCEVHMGLYRDAAAHLAYFDRLAPADHRSANAARLLALAKTRVGVLRVTVQTHEGDVAADVAVDGKVIGKAPLDDLVFVEPGHHQIEARSGAKLATIDVDVVAGVERPVGLEPQLPGHVQGGAGRAGGPGWGLVIGSGVVTLVALGAGAGLTIAANGKASDAATLRAGLKSSSSCSSSPAPSACGPLASDVSSKNTLSNAAVGTFVAGGVFALATVGLGVWQAVARKPATAIRVAPVVGANERGVVVLGAW